MPPAGKGGLLCVCVSERVSRVHRVATRGLACNGCRDSPARCTCHLKPPLPLAAFIRAEVNHTRDSTAQAEELAEQRRINTEQADALVRTHAVADARGPRALQRPQS